MPNPINMLSGICRKISEILPWNIDCLIKKSICMASRHSEMPILKESSKNPMNSSRLTILRKSVFLVVDKNDKIYLPNRASTESFRKSMVILSMRNVNGCFRFGWLNLLCLSAQLPIHLKPIIRAKLWISWYIYWIYFALN